MVSIKLLEKLEDNGVTTVATLRLLVYLKEPRSFVEIENVIGLDGSTVRKFIKRSSGLVKRVKIHAAGHRHEGNPQVKLNLTKKGMGLIETLINPKP